MLWRLSNGAETSNAYALPNKKIPTLVLINVGTAKYHMNLIQLKFGLPIHMPDCQNQPVDILFKKMLNPHNMNSIINLSANQLRRAADFKDEIETLQNQLSSLLGGTVGAATPRKRRRMSASARAKIGAAQKARWAKVKGRKPTAKPVKKARRKMSAAARARISAAAKARWKKAKAAGKNRL